MRGSAYPDARLDRGRCCTPERVRFVEQLRRYYAVFPAEQVLVLIYDDFRADNEGTVRRVLRFLGVDDRVALDVMEANPTVHVRSQRLHELLHELYRSDGARRRGRRRRGSRRSHPGSCAVEHLE